eukprot:m.153371 g.153371  ORF g.153371 m.153371 type:complete len:86 (+) comp30835_c0_seq26:168-425(+)
MSARNSYSMYGGGGGRTGSVRSSKRTTKEMNVRQEWSNSLNAGVSQPFSSSMYVDIEAHQNHRCFTLMVACCDVPLFRFMFLCVM